MDKFYDVLKQRIADHQSNFGYGGLCLLCYTRLTANASG